MFRTTYIMLASEPKWFFICRLDTLHIKLQVNQMRAACCILVIRHFGSKYRTLNYDKTTMLRDIKVTFP